MKLIILHLERHLELITGEAMWAMALTRVGVMSACAILVTFYGIGGITFAQQNQRPDVAIAVTQQQVIQNATALTLLRSQLDSQQQIVAQLRDEISLQKGVGIGIASVIGMLQALQMILQVKAVKTNGNSHHK